MKTETVSRLYTIYDGLVASIKNELWKAVLNSTTTSKHMDCKCINVSVFDYTELLINDDVLVFVDNSGYQYDLMSECGIEDLLDILKNE